MYSVGQSAGGFEGGPAFLFFDGNFGKRMLVTVHKNFQRALAVAYGGRDGFKILNVKVSEICLRAAP